MKKLFLLFTSLGLIACGSKNNDNDNTLMASIDAEEGSAVYFSTLNDNGSPEPKDTVLVKDGKINLALPNTDYQGLGILKLENNANGNVLFVYENEKIEGEIHADSLSKTDLKGGDNQDLLQEYMHFLNKQQKAGKALSEKFRNPELQENPTLASQLNEERDAFIEKESKFRKELIKNNPNSLVSVMILSDMLNMNRSSLPEIKSLFEGLSDKAQSTPAGKRIATFIKTNEATSEGSMAPNFTAKTPEGEDLSLKDAMGEVTLIDFWAAWCKPCRMENPNVVKMYNKYHDKGLNIIGVSLDKTKDAWVKAIEDDQLDWYHVSNLKYWNDPIAKMYQVRSIPSTFLLDKDGKIVAKNLRGQALENKVAELLGE